MSDGLPVEAWWQAAIRAWWGRRGRAVLYVTVALLAVPALVRLSDVYGLAVGSDPTAAIDTKNISLLVQRWVAGESVYGRYTFAIYPPANHLILWPLLGWLPIRGVRLLMTAVQLVGFVWLAALFVRESGAQGKLERTFVALLITSLAGTAVAIRNGQVTLPLLPLLLSGVILLSRQPGSRRATALGAALLLVSLAKFTVSAPFFWIPLFSARRLLPLILVAVGYAGLTLAAATFQADPLSELLRGWLTRSSVESATAGYGNLHAWLSGLGLQAWNAPASLLVLLALGAWTYAHRQVDLWLLLGVAALVARLWSYHRAYDDMLLLVPMLALFRLARSGPSPDGGDVLAGVLLALTILSMAASSQMEWGSPLMHAVYVVGHTVNWLVVLGFLLERSWRARRSLGVGGPLTPSAAGASAAI